MQGGTPRAYVLGGILVVLGVVWTIQVDLVWWDSRNWFALNYQAVFMLVLLVAGNEVVRRVGGVRPLAMVELRLVAIMILVSLPLAGHMFLQRLVPIIAHAHRYATPENRWESRLLPLLPRWLVTGDRTALDAIYGGNTHLYRADILLPLLVPLVSWIGFTLALVGTMLCLNRLLRRQWIERERLSYPVIELPFQITDPRARFWRQPLLWMGFGLAGSLDMFNGLSYYWPVLPEIRLLHDLRPYLQEKPWRNIGYIALSYRPHVIGLGYLIPADLSFSTWFFFLLAKSQLVFASAWGWDAIPDFPHLHYQSFGAYLAIFAFAAFSSGPQLRRAIRRRAGQKASEERRAAQGAAVGLVALTLFGIAMGLPWWSAVLFFLLYFAVAVAITRIRAESGVPVHDLLVQGPGWAMANLWGTGSFSGTALAVFAMLHWFNRDTSCHPMPYQLEAYKLGDRALLSPRAVTAAMAAAVILGSIAAVWAVLHTVTDLGGATAKIQGHFVWYGGQPYEQVGRWLATPTRPNFGATAALLVGGAFTWMLQVIRTRVIGCPFHPVGVALQAGWLMPNIWSELLVAWAIKVLVLRYGGLKAYRALMPFFLGLMLGEYTVQGFWALLGTVMQMPTYPFWD